ncbi:hypothetical protein R5R35_006797 [Gryllus longicercus]|uniref:Thymidylate kinase n=1 Tax=Gryllus longicercus TaxID=2509291 RepID=A0AAN9V623_9ORTH
MPGRGALIVLEGCDRVGKTTQASKLLEKLQHRGIPTQLLKFPDRSTSTGQIINSYLTRKMDLPDKTVHLLFSANRWESEPQMKKLLNSGVTLIVDRYSHSGVAFSAAKNEMSIHWCYQPEIGLPKPDLVLFLTLNETAISKRSGFGDERYENSEFLKKVASNFQRLKDDAWKIIDADKDIETLNKELLLHVEKVIESVKDTHLSYFDPIAMNNL